MSRIGRLPIAVPDGVKVAIDGRDISVTGPKGTLALTVGPEVAVSEGDEGLSVSPVGGEDKVRSKWGLYRTLVANLVEGVTEGFEKRLEINGVGYRAQMRGNAVSLQLGFSHDVNYPVPEGIKIECPDQTTIVVSGIDKQKVGQVAAELRGYRPPEPYKGKGVKYAGEYVYRKEGKKK